MTKSRQSLGRWGEELAAQFLVKKGYSIIDRNVRTTYGEIDLVASQGQTTVFVEVKTRTTTSFGLPEESITTRKRAHILDSAQAYIQEHNKLGSDWRVDVIAIRKFPHQKPEVTHFENAIT
jgi:putative endonuclease